jgi:hypothetical protein
MILATAYYEFRSITWDSSVQIEPSLSVVAIGGIMTGEEGCEPDGDRDRLSVRTALPVAVRCRACSLTEVGDGMERRQLPVHRTIVVVDVEEFGDRRRTNAHQVTVRNGLYAALRRAFDAVGLAWDACDREDRGDGVFILVPADIPKAAFVDSVPYALAVELREHNAIHSVGERIRLRMALHAGEVAYDEHGATAVSINLAFRLVDAEPLRVALANSPGILALITSEWFFDEVVRHSHETDPATFRPVQVAVKETSTMGWVGLPDHPYPSETEHLLAPPPVAPKRPIPHQLPVAPRAFTGRTDELAILTASVLNSKTGRDGTTAMAAVIGAGGIGKTWLALQWAHQHLDQFPDGQLFVDLRGFSPNEQALPTVTAMRGFLHALGVEPAQIPTALQTQTVRYRTLVAGKRILIVLDNAASTAQVLPLLPGSPTCTVLITSRRYLPGLVTGHSAHHLPAALLTDTNARALLTTRLGTARAFAESAAVDDLLALCGGFPLALSIAAGHAQTHSHLPLAMLTTELRDACLQALHEDRAAASLPTVLSWSYRALTEEQARILRLLGIAPGPDISLQAAASLAGLTAKQTWTILQALEQMSLLSVDVHGRYRMHDMTRQFANEQAHRDQPDRQTGLKRLVDFYLHTAHNAASLLYPNRPPLQLELPEPNCHPQLLSNCAAAQEWFDTEQTCLLATQHAATAYGWHQAAWQLAWTVITHQRRRDYFQDNVTAWQAGLAATGQLADTAARTLALRLLGDTHIRARRPEPVTGQVVARGW